MPAMVFAEARSVDGLIVPFPCQSSVWHRHGVRVRRDVRDHVLRLTYTAHDMAPFARDLGEPYKWDPEERRHLRARLAAGDTQTDVAL